MTIDIPDTIVETFATAVAERLAPHLAVAGDRGSPWMTVDEASQYSRIPLGTFRRLVAQGRIRTHEMPLEEGGRAKNKLIHRDDLDEDLGYVRDQAALPSPIPLRRSHGA